MENTTRILIFLMVILSSSCSYSQKSNRTEITNYIHYSIVINYYQDDRMSRGGSSETFESLLRNYGKLPSSPSELLDTLLVRYHPNEIIVDDFEIDQLRFHDNYQGHFVLYFIGPDGVDDKLELRFNHDDVADMSFEEYMRLKGDFILGSISNEKVKYFKDYFKKKNN